ncbi:hypothetical protein [Dysosmobacter sp.]|uniref:hypothetical protein n=1 Tax=Dysosmobacter sp. TaxID=2591382 RepID=UPI002A85CF47|nr:hypothetical protein [Dysosmobacter sp.]MDY3282715.1 hypothetical protein [Dysosmobacter sp.]
MNVFVKLIDCPYCHKKVYATRWQLMVRGRLSLVCPACRRFLYHAVRKRLLLMQTVMIFVAVLLCAGLARLNIPGGLLGKALALIAGVIGVMVLGELTASWVSRQALLQRETDRYVAKEKAAEAERKAAERAAKHKHKKKK